MKIVVIGGTGLIGSKIVAILRQAGHEAVAASPKGGVDTVTGEGLKEAIAGAQVVIDVSNAPSRDARAVLEQPMERVIGQFGSVYNDWESAPTLSAWRFVCRSRPSIHSEYS
jgi:nucleoside-diphosphate-sugar epimerase